MMTNAGKKKIFISDIHMGDARSQDESQPGRYPYGWFRKNISNLEDFLTKQLNDPEVAEVVILGDLFDEWVIPTEQSPLTSFQNIYDNPKNNKVIEALQHLSKKKIVSYVPGNHDMTLSTTDPDRKQKFMKEKFPDISYLADGVYRCGRLVAEHGHRYSLFNAADEWTKKCSPLPLGYFISRLVAHKNFNNREYEDFLKILRKFIDQSYQLFIKPPKKHLNLVHAVYEAVVRYAGSNDSATIEMIGIADSPAPTVGAIGTLYSGLLENWISSDRISWEKALIGDKDLSLAAEWICSLPDYNIIIFGHTHEWCLGRICDFQAIYANCGAWVDTAPCCTYVETQEDLAEKYHYVRVRRYPNKKVLSEDYITL
jgi:UDP-2,3-diacylglucosamine pyrophosphatase LpxH